MKEDELKRLHRVEETLRSVQEAVQEDGRRLSGVEEKLDALLELLSQQEADKEAAKDHPDYGVDPATSVKSMSLQLSEDTARLYHEEDYGLAGRAQEILDRVKDITIDQVEGEPGKEPMGVDAQTLADSLDMQRHQVSSILHQLFLLRKLDKKRFERKMYYRCIR